VLNRAKATTLNFDESESESDPNKTEKLNQAFATYQQENMQGPINRIEREGTAETEEARATPNQNLNEQIN
jgi:hypothetical protein